MSQRRTCCATAAAASSLEDFGIGRDLKDDEPAAGLAGTPAYIAPEIFAGHGATPRSDLYSLGALLFHLATKRYPVEGCSLRSLRDAHENGARVSLATLRPDLPAAVVNVIDRALSVDAAARYATAAEMAAALEGASATAPATSTRRSVWLGAVAVAQSSNFSAEWLQVRDHLAQLYRRVGRHREGEAVDTQLLKLLAVADEDHPIRRRAAERLATSTASAGRPRARLSARER